ncbi:brevican core protein-like [Patiria miniata]|uniref:C-type lectin domain-containing protein n=1 Tax=Patiria miniata TaxID=46514 RepID=A0A914ARI0_PATMI|nr:brevican core protein-like [Patiria miniata]
MEWVWGCILLVLPGGLQISAQTVSASEDPNSVFCHSNPCQNNGTCVNMLRPGSDRSLSVCKNGACYKLILEKKTWEEATLACNVMGSSLIAMETTEVQGDFVNTIKDHHLHSE